MQTSLCTSLGPTVRKRDKQKVTECWWPRPLYYIQSSKCWFGILTFLPFMTLKSNQLPIDGVTTSFVIVPVLLESTYYLFLRIIRKTRLIKFLSKCLSQIITSFVYHGLFSDPIAQRATCHDRRNCDRCCPVSRTSRESATSSALPSQEILPMGKFQHSIEEW